MKKIFIPSINEYAIVDDIDYDTLKNISWYGRKNSTGDGIYVCGRVKLPNGKWGSKKMHHFIVKQKHPYVIDHINRNPLDNRRSNLRLVSRTENALNSKQFDSIKGFTIDRYGRYNVRFSYNGKSYNVGTFKTKEEAIDARNKMRNEIISKCEPIITEYYLAEKQSKTE